MNEIERVKSFIEDYRVLCKKHGLYIGQEYDKQQIQELSPNDLVDNFFLPYSANIGGSVMSKSFHTDEWEVDYHE